MPAISNTLATLAAALSAPRAARSTGTATPRGPSRQDRFLEALRADVAAQSLYGIALPLLAVERLWCDQHDPATANAKTPWRSLDAGLRTDAVANALPADVLIISAEEMKRHGLKARACIVIVGPGQRRDATHAEAIQALREANRTAVAARAALVAHVGEGVVATAEAMRDAGITAADLAQRLLASAIERSGLDESAIQALRELASDGDADAVAELAQYGLAVADDGALALADQA